MARARHAKRMPSVVGGGLFFKKRQGVGEIDGNISVFDVEITQRHGNSNFRLNSGNGNPDSIESEYLAETAEYLNRERIDDIQAGKFKNRHGWPAPGDPLCYLYSKRRESGIDQRRVNRHNQTIAFHKKKTVILIYGTPVSRWHLTNINTARVVTASLDFETYTTQK